MLPAPATPQRQQEMSARPHHMKEEELKNRDRVMMTIIWRERESHLITAECWTCGVAWRCPCPCLSRSSVGGVVSGRRRRRPPPRFLMQFVSGTHEGGGEEEERRPLPPPPPPPQRNEGGREEERAGPPLAGMGAANLGVNFIDAERASA